MTGVLTLNIPMVWKKDAGLKKSSYNE